MNGLNARVLFSFFLGFFLAACTTKENPKAIPYDGPLKKGENIEMHYAEKGKVKTIMRAKKVNEFQNGNQEFPEGIYLEFYNEAGKMTSQLSADKAYYFKSENKWRGQGHVEVKNLQERQQLNSEELFWFPSTKKISTDKFVTIVDKQDVLYGTGLTANQDLSDYSLKNPSGDLHSEEDENVQ